MPHWFVPFGIGFVIIGLVLSCLISKAIAGRFSYDIGKLGAMSWQLMSIYVLLVLLSSIVVPFIDRSLFPPMTLDGHLEIGVALINALSGVVTEYRDGFRKPGDNPSIPAAFNDVS